MTYRERARAAARPISGILVAGLLVVVAAIGAVPGYQLLASSATPSSAAAGPSSTSPSTAASAAQAPPGAHADTSSASPTAASPAQVIPDERPGPPVELPAPQFGRPGGVPRNAERKALGESDGAVPDGTAVFDGGVPGVAKLDGALLSALRRAATAAADDGVQVYVESGWRSRRYQDQLLQEAVAKYGSKEKAARWVATPDTSAHVSGDAVDVEPAEATAWLTEHGAAYGLCQIYRNEPWHYELRPAAVRNGCPRMYADPTHDPRMQRDPQRISAPGPSERPSRAALTAPHDGGLTLRARHATSAVFWSGTPGEERHEATHPPHRDARGVPRPIGG